jgi:hypothetical protein
VPQRQVALGSRPKQPKQTDSPSPNAHITLIEPNIVDVEFDPVEPR